MSGLLVGVLDLEAGTATVKRLRAAASKIEERSNMFQPGRHNPPGTRAQSRVTPQSPAVVGIAEDWHASLDHLAAQGLHDIPPSRDIARDGLREWP